MRTDRRAALKMIGAAGTIFSFGCAGRHTAMTATRLSQATLGRIHEVMGAHVQRGELPGLVLLLARRGEVHVDAIGRAAIGGATPMRRDTIFRISSMTKPITAAAAMSLVEEGKLRLDEPVDRLLPELANRRVLARVDGPLTETVPAARAITVRDLLTFRMGFGIVWGPQDALPIQKAAIELELGAFGPPRPQTPPPPDEWMRRFGTLPLMHQPGEQWMYNTGFEVLSVLVARASGRPLEALLRERVFEPLGMKDTAFTVPPAKQPRLATSYAVNPTSGALDLYDPPEGGEWNKAPAFPSGAAGLVSTIDDYFAFGQMMLDGGTYRGMRVLSPASVRAMTTDQITPAQKAASAGSLAPGFWRGRGWGFGVSIAIAPDAISSEPGRFGWDGGLGTSWTSHPKEETVAILMTQRSEYPDFSSVYRDFWSAAYRSHGRG